jgi:N6-adenosine-specific RNA methylase IME4
MTFLFHPLANLFPMMSSAERAETKESMRINGQRKPIVVLDDQILDGRNRYELCLELGIPPHMRPYDPSPSGDGPDPLTFVLDENLHRRQLSESQRAMVAARLANMKQGARTDLPSFEGKSVSQSDAGNVLSVSVASVERAARVVRDGSDELQHKVDTGELRVSTAALIAKLPKEEQVRLLQDAAPDAVKAAAKKINAKVREGRRASVRALHTALSLNSSPLPLGRKYPVIYADPATRFEAGVGNRSVENHYPTETIEDWCKLPVRDMALPDCLLLCWSTVPQLAATIRLLLPAWGFEYKSCLCWDKTSPEFERESATGFWARNQHELLLIATCGSPSLPEPRDVPMSMFRERKGRHSAKPNRFYEVIERMTPGLPRIELFARARRQDWDAWGNEIKDDEVGVVEQIAPAPTLVDDALELPNFLRRGHPDCIISPEIPRMTGQRQAPCLEADQLLIANRLSASETRERAS